MASRLARKRVCLLTGAGGRLGTAFCRRYADRYDIVAVCRRRIPAVPSQEQVLVDPLAPAAAIRANRHPVFIVRADLSRDEQLERVVEVALSRFERIDLVVNAAVHSVWAPIVESSRLLDSAPAQFGVNAILPLRLSALVVRRAWRESDRESRRQNRNIVNLSSTAGSQVYPGHHQSVYSASKAALNFLSFHMADELAHCGVRVNALAPNSFPGIVPTERVADAIVRLDEGRMTGTLLVVDRDGDRLVDAAGQPAEDLPPAGRARRARA